MRLARGLVVIGALLVAAACGVKSLPRPPSPEGAPAPQAGPPVESEPCQTCADGGTIPPRIPE